MPIGPLSMECAEAAKAVGAAEVAIRAAQVICIGESFQLKAFRAADTILTTFVLAGGADGIHQIIKRFSNTGSSAS